MSAAERDRLAAARAGAAPWRKWGPYLSERQWGTVREDYSADGAAWDFVTHDHARSKAYRWGEDGLAGWSDDLQRLCFSVALWNGKDPILKERLFGLAGPEGNHGEDVKEHYAYLDGVPSHAWMRMLYKYPQAEYPYARLVEENRRRGKDAPEFELLDTGVFDEDRYFDVECDFAKAGPEDLCVRVTVRNRGPAAATIRVLPQLFFRNTWSWTPGAARPSIVAERTGTLRAEHPELGVYRLYADGAPETYFVDNDTNVNRLYGVADARGYWKDGIGERVVRGAADAVNPAKFGTKAAADYRLVVPAGGSASVRVRLVAGELRRPFADFDAVMDARRAEADAFYADLQRGMDDADARLVQRQAFAGMLWSKQYYGLDVPRWLSGDPAQPAPPEARKRGRNRDWEHLNNADVLSMPDKWEYPWYAAWDLAFHCLPLALVDPDFAKDQLILLTREWYMHPNGQMPAYEWAFGDVNPPVHAWATWRVFQIDRKRSCGEGDFAFLERVFHKLCLNFTWWVNRKDAEGRNLFQGGFLGLDNIGLFDRSAPLPGGGHLEQADGTAWMAAYALQMMRIALELATRNPVYEDLATKFFEHFLHIAGALNAVGGEHGESLWDDEDEFFYDVLHDARGRRRRLRVRSMVGLVPLFAVETLEPELLEKTPEFARRLEWFLNYRPDLAALVSRWHEPGQGERRLLALCRGRRMKRVLKRVLDEAEFLAPYGVRAVSKVHAAEPYALEIDGARFEVRYEPGESSTGLFGGNSNWRGPIWMPMNYLLVESLQKFHHYYGDDFRVECPTGSGRLTTLRGAADELSSRLQALFLRDGEGRRPMFGASEKLQRDPHFRDVLVFPEYFHGDTGRGVGAMHQTGWTGLVAKLLMPRA